MNQKFAGPDHGSTKPPGKAPVKLLNALTALSAASLLLVTLSAGMAQTQRPAAKRSGTPAGNAGNGKNLFANVGCAECHGRSANGGAGPKIAPPPASFAGFIATVRHPSGQMRPFSTAEVSDAQLADIYVFLQLLSGPPQANSAAAAAPAGNAENGKKIYVADGCYECHGYAAQGGAGTGPKLGPNPISFSAVLTELRHPRDQMPPYTDKVISDAQVGDIYAFLQSLPQPPNPDSIPILK